MAVFTFAKPIDSQDYRSGWSSPRKLSSGESAEHQGMDIAAKVGTPVRAIADGVVTLSQDHNPTAGNWIAIRHTGSWTGLSSRYIHLNRRLVEEGETVRAGQLIGLSGETATEGAPHLHFDLQATAALAQKLVPLGLQKVGRLAPGTGGYNIPVEQFFPGARNVSGWPLLGAWMGGGLLLLAAAIGLGGWWWWRRRSTSRST